MTCVVLDAGIALDALVTTATLDTLEEPADPLLDDEEWKRLPLSAAVQLEIGQLRP